MRHLAESRPAGDEQLPMWMADVLCDLQRAADDRGLDVFASHIRQLRARHGGRSCECDRPTGLIC